MVCAGWSVLGMGWAGRWLIWPVPVLGRPVFPGHRLVCPWTGVCWLLSGLVWPWAGLSIGWAGHVLGWP